MHNEEKSLQRAALAPCSFSLQTQHRDPFLPKATGVPGAVGAPASGTGLQKGPEPASQFPGAAAPFGRSRVA